MSKQQALTLGLVAVVFGVVAAGVVWYLERFETDRMLGEIQRYLAKVDRFRAYEAEHGGGDGGD